ncbi:tRNA (Adenine(58)-N(1))-methyltransferase non-catalytic subunit TRM6 [Fasciola hepatica]|uniref:tRNA (adenine(58)-N(1))-methyltransferase non-catalytic subunit TRM6 n=1 Tax=Fasciola hepatica TaxID=6192 RepID=A0A4E0RFV9_FASHE|nr:tRNA (Adenine(58)-N(1))-methyltransferase non-catalytic subunit TRM6 [Fasciola hepatica]
MNPVAAAAYETQVNSIAYRDVVHLLTGGPAVLTTQPNSTPEESPCDDITKISASATSETTDNSTPNADPLSTSALEPSECCDAVCERRLIRQEKRRIGFERLLGPNAKPPDALIIATRFHPVDLTLILMQFLPSGRPIVVYSQFLQPLVDLYNAIKQRGGVTHLRLTDTWFRTIQVLPERTHPEVTMTSSGGYLLTAYTVEPKPADVLELFDTGLVTSAYWDECGAT